MTAVPIKVSYNGVKRRLSLAADTKYEGFQNILCDMFPVTRPFSVTYIDNDNDVVALSSDAELTELFRLVHTNLISTVSITLHDGENPPPTPEHPPQYAHEHPQHRGPGRRQRHGFGGRHGAPWARGGGFGGHRFGGHGYGGPGYGGPGFGGPGCRGAGFGFGMPGFMGAFLPFMQSMPEFSEDVRSTFSAVREQAMSSNIDHHSVFPVVKQAFPVLGKSVADAIDANEDDLPTESIDTIVNELQSKLKDGPLPETLVTSILQLVRAGLKDATVMNIVRNVPLRDMISKLENMDMEMFRGDGFPRGGEMFDSSVDPFKVHSRVACDGCDKVPTIIGTRYKCTNRDDFDLCEECFEKPEKKEDMTFDKFEYAWSSESKDDKVPKAPLNIGDHGSQVLFLQKVLTDLGYMNKQMFARRAGFYAKRTRAAIEKFQKEFGLESSAINGVYDATTAATLESVIAGKTENSAAGPSTAQPEVKV